MRAFLFFLFFFNPLIVSAYADSYDSIVQLKDSALPVISDEDDEGDCDEDCEDDIDDVEEGSIVRTKLKEEGKDPEIRASGCLESWSLKVRGAAFVPVSHRFQDVYKTIVPTIEVEGSIKFPQCLELWANLSSFFYRARIHTPVIYKRMGNIVNFSVGFKISKRLCGPIEIYAGLGPSLAWTDIYWGDPKNYPRPENDFHFNKKSCELTWGAILKSGLYYYFTTHAFLDIFVDYLYQPWHYRDTHLDIGGFKVGVGLGVGF